MSLSLLHYLSWTIGKLAPLEHPRFLAKMAVKIFAKLVSADLNEASKPIDEYLSVQKFFTRSLKDGVRPVGEGVVSPVDGTLRTCGSVNSDEFTYIKGRKYELDNLLGSAGAGKDFTTANYFNLYLSPKDYHHIHSPCDGKITKIDHIPGSLWPVNDWSMRNVDGLLFSNERLVFYIDSEFGKVALVMVAATNVGQIKTPFIDYTTNLKPWSRRKGLETLSCDYPIDISKGELIGSFLLGSSVLLLVPESLMISSELTSSREVSVKYGQTLAKI